MLRVLADIGFVNVSDMGRRAYSALDLAPMLQPLDSPVRTWRELRVLSYMSHSFLDGLNEGSNPFSIPPWER